MSNEVTELDVNKTASQDAVEQESSKKLTELSEDIEVVGPGQMLAQAREKRGFTQQHIAHKLNFRLTLVENIEADIFDSSLPETFNRGYLCAFAKLVNISNEDILNSYDTLSIAKIQCAEMQSFSRSTQKDAQNNLLMWISYLIVAILIGSTFMWWLQNSDNKKLKTLTSSAKIIATNIVEPPSLTAENSVDLVNENITDSTSVQRAVEQKNVEEKLITTTIIDSSVEPKSIIPLAEQPIITTVSAIFTFSGDCWVSIYDATGERIAYGVKKTGYVMNITGKPPFKVDIGRPALTSIEFNGEVIDMSVFDKDNIAKFTLPITTE